VKVLKWRWAKPRVVYREINGEKCEPFEVLTVDVEDTNQGAVMEELGRRRGDLQDMQPDGHGRVRLEYRIPARGLIGFQSEFMTMTRVPASWRTCSTTTRRSRPICRSPQRRADFG